MNIYILIYIYIYIKINNDGLVGDKSCRISMSRTYSVLDNLFPNVDFMPLFPGIKANFRNVYFTVPELLFLNAH